LNIYFAGSIRAGREDVPVYERIIRHLKQFGPVLTEHVGDYQLSVHGQHHLDDVFIHDRDVAWLLSSDVVVAEVTVPSLGVGYEIATAVRSDIPVIALFRGPVQQLSAMISGSRQITVIAYHDVELVLPELDNALQGIGILQDISAVQEIVK
jgi:hypothetical protein